MLQNYPVSHKCLPSPSYSLKKFFKKEFDIQRWCLVVGVRSETLNARVLTDRSWNRVKFEQSVRCAARCSSPLLWHSVQLSPDTHRRCCGTKHPALTLQEKKTRLTGGESLHLTFLQPAGVWRRGAAEGSGREEEINLSSSLFDFFSHSFSVEALNLLISVCLWFY